MKTCKGCGLSLKRGWTGGGTFASGQRYCLVCATARTMASFMYPPKQKNEGEHHNAELKDRMDDA